MTQVSLEVNNHFREDTLPKNTANPTTNEVIILGEDNTLITYTGTAEFIGPQLPTIHDPEFIGPRDAVDVRRNYLETKARDLAKIAVTNFPMYEKYRAEAISAVKGAMNDGEIRLGGEFGVTADEQAEQFVLSTMNAAYKPKEAVVAELKAHAEAVHLGKVDPRDQLKNELTAVREQLALQGNRILQLRTDLKDRGASDEFLRHFDYMMRLMTKPQREAYEIEKELAPEVEDAPLVNTEQLTINEAFIELVKQISRKSLDLVGIHAPHSAPVTVQKSLTRYP